jgi:PadR family transcriptional regulator PadR
MEEATPQRGGRAKRMVRVAPKGVHAAKDFYDAVTRVSHGASWAVNRIGSIT